MLCKNIYRELFTHPQKAAMSGMELVSCKTSGKKVLEVYHIFTTSSFSLQARSKLVLRERNLWGKICYKDLNLFGTILDIIHLLRGGAKVTYL